MEHGVAGWALGHGVAGLMGHGVAGWGLGMESKGGGEGMELQGWGRNIVHLFTHTSHVTVV